jgi:Tol biopolymer transport system component
MIGVLLAIAALVGALAGTRPAASETIAFTKLHPTGSGISVIQANGQGERSLTNHRGWRDTEPDWSPDGRLIAFTRSTDGGRSMHVYVMRADGSHARRITTGSFDMGAAWAPSGRWIAYAAMSGIRLMRPDGSHNHLLPGTRSGASSPAWSPDSKLIAWTKPYATGREQTVVERLDGSARRHLLSGREPAWSPDGQAIAFTGQDGGVFRMAAGGGGVRGLGKGMHPSWSGDSQRITFARWPADSRFSVWLMSADGSERHALVTGGLDPDWRG